MLAELFRAARPATTAVGTATPGDLQAIAGWQNAQFGNWPGYDASSVLWVTDAQALGLPVISAFLDISTALVVQMGLDAYSGGVRLEATPPILRNPAPGPNRVLADWVREYLRAAALRGNYVAVLGDNGPSGWPEVMYPVPNGQWSVEQMPDGSIWYTIAATRYPSSDVFHVLRNAEPGELVGRGLLDTHRDLIAASVAAERWATRYFEGGAVPPAHIEHPDPDLTQEQALELKGKYNETTRRREALVTPAGIKVNALASDAEKAQLADTRRANDQKLAMACGIPGALLGLDSPSLTYRNITDVFQQFLSTTIMGYLEPLEQQLSSFCLPREVETRFQTAAVLRPDIAERMAIAVQGYGNQLMTRNEGRALIDLPEAPGLPVGEGEELRKKAEAFGLLVRSGVDPRSAAAAVGLTGLEFIDAMPVTLRESEPAEA
jgi:HK97 family phage portal protein